MGLELSLERSKLVLMRSGNRSQLLLMPNEQRLQSLSIEPIKIR
jgi:hypothetical protein